MKTAVLPLGSKPLLDFDVSAARIEVLPLSPGEEPRIAWKRGAAPLEIRRIADKVFVRAAGTFEAPSEDAGVIESAVRTLIGGGYGGEFTLWLPRNVKARISTNMGQARIRGLVGCDLEVSTNAGQVELDGCHGRFVLKAKAGQIIGKRLGGTFSVESGAGEALLDIVSLDDGVHTVHSTMGAVKIDLAPGLDVRIDSHSVIGSTRTKYPSKSDARAVLKLEADLGAVKVREGEAWVDPKAGDWPDWRKTWAIAPVEAASAPPAKDDLRTILELVQQKKISPEEAERLIAAL
jgi:hypothetical protein